MSAAAGQSVKRLELAQELSNDSKRGPDDALESAIGLSRVSGRRNLAAAIMAAIEVNVVQEEVAESEEHKSSFKTSEIIGAKAAALAAKIDRMAAAPAKVREEEYQKALGLPTGVMSLQIYDAQRLLLPTLRSNLTDCQRAEFKPGMSLRPRKQYERGDKGDVKRKASPKRAVLVQADPETKGAAFAAKFAGPSWRAKGHREVTIDAGMGHTLPQRLAPGRSPRIADMTGARRTDFFIAATDLHSHPPLSSNEGSAASSSDYAGLDRGLVLPSRSPAVKRASNWRKDPRPPMSAREAPKEQRISHFSNGLADDLQIQTAREIGTQNSSWDQILSKHERAKATRWSANAGQWADLKSVFHEERTEMDTIRKESWLGRVIPWLIEFKSTPPPTSRERQLKQARRGHRRMTREILLREMGLAQKAKKMLKDINFLFDKQMDKLPSDDELDNQDIVSTVHRQIDSLKRSVRIPEGTCTAKRPPRTHSSTFYTMLAADLTGSVVAVSATQAYSVGSKALI